MEAAVVDEEDDGEVMLMLVEKDVFVKVAYSRKRMLGKGFLEESLCRDCRILMAGKECAGNMDDFESEEIDDVEINAGAAWCSTV